jgi:hypothetical protein
MAKMQSSDILITIRHARACGLCSQGSREFAKRHNFDWRDFVKNGIPASKLLATNDAMAQKVVEFAKTQPEI